MKSLTKLQEMLLRTKEGTERNRFIAQTMDLRTRDFLEAYGSADFADLVVDAAHVRAQKAWDQAGGIWRNLVTIGPGVADFKVDNFLAAGNFAPLGVVTELAQYPNAVMSDQKVTLQVSKRGAIFPISMEARLNDAVRLLSDWAKRFNDAANEALEKATVYTMLDQNPTIYDSTALFTSGHANNVGNSGGYNRAQLILALSKMRQQTGLDGNKITLVPKYLVVHPDKEVEAREDVASMEKIQVAGTTSAIVVQGAQNGLRGLNLEVLTSPWLSTAAFYVVADPMRHDGLLTEFLGGREAPELFTEAENAGFSFDHDAIRNKVRHVWGQAWVDFRTVVRGGV